MLWKEKFPNYKYVQKIIWQINKGKLKVHQEFLNL